MSVLIRFVALVVAGAVLATGIFLALQGGDPDEVRTEVGPPPSAATPSLASESPPVVAPTIPPASATASPPARRVTSPAPRATPRPPACDVARELALSTYGKHEGGPLVSVPSYFDWAPGSVNKPITWPFRRWINIWGQAEVAADSPGGLNVRLRLQRPAIYFLDGNGRWTKAAEPTAGKSNLWTSTVTFVNEKWTQGGSFPHTYDKATDTWLIDMKQFPKGTLPHWAWDSYHPRLQVPADAKGIVTAGYARVEGTDAARAPWILGMSSDHFGGPRDNGTQTNPAIGAPRHKRVTGEWRLFGYSTLSEAELRRNPPPVPPA